MVLSLLVAAALIFWTHRVESRLSSPFPIARVVPFHPRLSSPSGAVLETPAAEFPFRPGETVGQVLADLGVGSYEGALVVAELSRHADLRRLRTNDRFAAVTLPDSSLSSFELTIAGKGRARVERVVDSWVGSFTPFVRSTREAMIEGHLEGFLEASVIRAGGEPDLAYRMSEVFQWDLDFTRDLRTGDRFEVLYERVFLDDAYDSVGEIRAVAYTNQGRRLEAYRWGDPAAYYNAEGRPMRKMFLRSPLRFSRITSRYTHRRFHPILKTYRPHYGVDYGAPTGTPVRATAGGVVSFAGWDRGGGRTVKIRHPNDYQTAYLHFSRFASGIRAGRRVSQGDVVGYVGSSGLATGSHLDYRVQHRGRWINPLSIKSVPADPVPIDELPRFLALRDELRGRLEWRLPDAPEARDRVAESVNQGSETVVRSP